MQESPYQTSIMANPHRVTRRVNQGSKDAIGQIPPWSKEVLELGSIRGNFGQIQGGQGDIISPVPPILLSDCMLSIIKCLLSQNQIGVLGSTQAGSLNGSIINSANSQTDSNQAKRAQKQLRGLRVLSADLSRPDDTKNGVDFSTSPLTGESIGKLRLSVDKIKSRRPR